MNIRILQLLQVGNIIAVVLTIIVNGLANLLPIGGKYTGELSDNIPNLFVPAGITFSIWGIIYILIIFFSIYLAKDLFNKEKTTKPFLEKTSYFFILASLANIIWIFLWHYEQIFLSLLAMIFLFVSLLFIYLRLNIGLEKLSIKEKLFVHTPISVYIGWITVATVANVTAVLVTFGWDGFGISESTWTILVLIIVAIISVLMIVKRKDIAYGLVIIWALLGIAFKRFEADPVYGIQTGIATTSLFVIIIIFITIVIISLKYNIKNIRKN
jgi:hypothetical protein